MHDSNPARNQTDTTMPSSFRFEQNHGDLFILYLKTMVLTVLTLGIYSFWGRVAITKYLHNHTSFGKNTFDYHATGKEMFLGFIKGVCILAPVLLILKLSPTSLKIIFSLLIYFGTIFFLAPLIVLGKWRFWLSRSSYCNIRFGHKGEYKPFRNLWIKGVLKSIITIGIYSPVFRNQIQKYYFNHTRFGNLPFAYTGDNWEFFWIWFKGALATVFTLGLYSFWYVAKLNRYVMSHTTFNGRSFNSTMTGGGLFKIALLNILIVICTLSLGFPIAVNRMYGYYFSNITLDISPSEIVALADEMDTGASALASGLEEAANVIDSISGII